MPDATNNSTNINQDVLYSAIVLIGQRLFPTQSVQSTIKNLYQTVFNSQLIQKSSFNQHDQQIIQLIHQNEQYDQQQKINLEQLQQNQIGQENVIHSRVDNDMNEHGKNVHNHLQSTQTPIISLMQQYNPLFRSQAKKQFQYEEYVQASLANFKDQLRKLPYDQKIQLLKNIKMQGASPQQKQRIRKMKLNAFKATSRHYKHMKCELIQIQMEQEQQISNSLNKSKLSQLQPDTESKKLKQTIFKKSQKQLKHKQPNTAQTDQLKDWFDKQQQLDGEKYIQNLDGLKEKNIDNNYYLEEENSNKNSNQHNQNVNKQTGELTAQQLRQHYEISKCLCIYTDQYSDEAVRTDDPLDDPEFVSKYFNFPDFAKQDKIQLQTFKDHFLQRLEKAIKCLKVFMKYGYGTRLYRKCHPQDKTMVKDKYGNYIWFGMRMAFRQMQHYLIIHCGKKVPVLTYTELYLISFTFYRIRQMYSERSKQTWFNVLRAAFKIDSIVHITKNDIYYFYNQMRKKLVQRRDAIQNKLTLTIDKENQFAVKYHNYSEDGEIDFFGLDNGIEGVKNIFAAVQTETKSNRKFKRALSTWSQEFQIQYYKLYMQFRKLGEVRRHLLKRFKGPIYQTQFNLKTSLNFRMERLTRKSIEFIQIQFRRYCQMMDIKQLNFYQKKFLTLNFSEIRVISVNQQGIDCRLLVYDYYLNNKYGKNRNDQTSIHLIKYRLTYINYLIESMAQLLEHKKKLSDVLNQPEEQRYKTFDLQKIKGRGGSCINKDVVQLDQEQKNVHEFVICQMQKIREYWANKGFKGLNYLQAEGQGKIQCKQLKEQKMSVKRQNNQSIRVGVKRRGRPPKVKKTIQDYFGQVKTQNKQHNNNITTQNQQSVIRGKNQIQQSMDWQQFYLDQHIQEAF